MSGSGTNDTFNGVLQADGATGTTIQAGDAITGGAGTDTLAVSVAGAVTAGHTISAVQTTGVENVLVSNFDTADPTTTTVATALMTGVTTVGLSASGANGDTAFTGMKNFVDAEMRNGAGDLTLTYDGAQSVSGETDSQNLTVSNLSGGTFTANGVETINVTTESSKSTLTDIVGTDLTEITFAGDQNLTVSSALDEKTLDASAMTGALTIELGAATHTVTGGAGNDVIDAVATLSNADTITGGAGTDTLKLSAGATAIAVGTADSKGDLYNVTGFETFDVEATNNAATLNLDNVDGITSVAVGAAKLITLDDLNGVLGGTGNDASFILNGTTHTVTATFGGVHSEHVVTGLISFINASVSGITATATADKDEIVLTADSGEAIEFSTLRDETGDTAITVVSNAYYDASLSNLTDQAVDVYAAATVTARLKDASGTEDVMNINLKTLAADKGFDHTIGTVTADNIETINLSATGMTDGKIKTVTSLAANGAKVLNISGDSDLTIGGFGTQIESIDGSTATGDLNLTVGTKDHSIKTGVGNDTINMAGTLTAEDTIDGGGNSVIAGGSETGKDKLTASGDIGTVTTPAALKIANVETIEVAAGGAAASYIDAAGITGAETIAFSATSGTVKITNLAAGTKIGLGETTNRFEGTMDIALADATGAADAISFTTASVDAPTTVALTVDAAVETVNIAASTNADNARTATFTNTDNAAKNIVVTAGHADDTVALGTLNAATTNVDASALKAKLTVTTAAAGAVTVSANGEVANDITTGDGADTITLVGKLGTTIQTIDGGAGNDVLNVEADSTATNFTSVSNVETINITVGANTDAGFDDGTEDAGLNTATTVNILGGDSLSTFTVGTTSGVIDKNTAATTIDASTFGGTTDLTVAAGGLNSFLTLKGGASADDVVSTTVSTAETGAKVAEMSGFETLVVTSTNNNADNSELDLSNVTGLTTIDTVFDTAGTADKITLSKVASGVNITVASTEDNDNLIVDLTDKAAADNTLDLELKTNTQADDLLNFDAAGVETLNIKASGTTASLINLAGVTATETEGNVAVNVTGTGALTLKALNSQTNVVNASAATGAITLASGDRAATAMTITTGTGNDTVAMRHANDVLNGGLGTDELAIAANLVLGGIQVDLSSTTDQVTSFNGSANSAVQVGFENVDLSGITGSFGADITAAATGSTITGTANADQITGGAGDDTVVFTSSDDVVSLGDGSEPHLN